MSDGRSWGRTRCEAIDDHGVRCSLDASHEGNHLTEQDAPRDTGSYLTQVGAIIVLVVIGVIVWALANRIIGS